jgi:hypothetical protein
MSEPLDRPSADLELGVGGDPLGVEEADEVAHGAKLLARSIAC